MLTRPLSAAPLVLSVAVLLLSGCAGPSAPGATPAPTTAAAVVATSTSAPTETAGVASAPSAQITEASTPSPTAVPTETETAPTEVAEQTQAAETPTLAAEPTQAAAGQVIYQASCVSCHGVNGAGGVKIGEETSADIRGAELNETFGGDKALISRAILDGKDEEGNDLSTAMPRFRGKLTDQQVNEVIAYLYTFK